MTKLTYKELLHKVHSHLDRMSAEDLRNLILNWARAAEYSERHEFLAKLNSTTHKRNSAVDLEKFLDDIETFATNVRDGAYCTGWGWDADYGEERDWGDESWAEEVDQFFRTAQKLVRQGEFTCAEQAYRLLFDTLEMGEEPGHFPGDPNPYSMLAVNVDEQIALFLHACYTNWEPDERPKRLFDELKRTGYIGHVGLQDLIDCAEHRLPDQDAFLADWIQFLEGQPLHLSAGLMREAVKLQGGIASLAKLARDNPDKYPEGYLEWLEALQAEGKSEEALQVAQEALAAIPEDRTIRAQIAEHISAEGERRKSTKLKLEGYLASFIASPKIGYLLDLYLTAWEEEAFDQTREEVLQRISYLRDQGGISHYVHADGSTTSLSKGTYYHTLVLSGEYGQLFDLCKGSGPLGWSDGNNPKPFLVLSLLFLLSRGGKYDKNLARQWERLTSISRYYPDPEPWQKYHAILEKAYAPHTLDEGQQSAYLDWCIKQVEARVKALISNKYRNSYFKGAELVVALAETLMNLNRGPEAIALINGYHKKYSRHSAFRRELREATELAGID